MPCSASGRRSPPCSWRSSSGSASGGVSRSSSRPHRILIVLSLPLPLDVAGPSGGDAGTPRARAALAVLGLRRVRPAVRGRRDDERQLGNALHGHRSRGVGRPGVHRADHVLGDGHGRPHPVRRDRAPVPRDADVPAAAVRGGRGARPDRGTAERRRAGRRAGLRPRRPWLLGAPAADDQLRPGASWSRWAPRSPGCSSPSTRWATGWRPSGSGRCRKASASRSRRCILGAAVVAVAMGALSFVVVRQPRPATA